MSRSVRRQRTLAGAEGGLPAAASVSSSNNSHGIYGDTAVRLAKYLAHAGVASRARRRRSSPRPRARTAPWSRPRADVDDTRAVLVDAPDHVEATRSGVRRQQASRVVSTASDRRPPTIVELVPARALYRRPARRRHDRLILVTNDASSRTG